MIFTERIEKLLGANHIKEVIEEFLKFLNDVPQSSRDARNDANQLRGQIIILSGRFTDLNTRMNTNTIDPASANQEKSVIINSFVQILNQLPSSYPDLNNYLDEKNEDDEWKEAQEKNNIESYQDYFSKYPNGKYKAATIKLISELEDVKLKQDMEIKRLAMLEKERRENDKAATIEMNRMSSGNKQQTYAARITATQPVKSSKGLYIGLGIVLGIVLLSVIAVMVSPDDKKKAVSEEQTNMTTDTKPDPATATEVVDGNTISESVKAELISAIRLSDNAEINAFYSLNSEYLYKSFTGEALKTGLSEIETLRSSDLFMTSTLDAQEFISFKLHDNGEEAEVDIVETWTSMYSRISTQQCYSKLAPARLPQTLFLKKTGNGWMISTIVQKNTTPSQTLPCN